MTLRPLRIVLTGFSGSGRLRLPGLLVVLSAVLALAAACGGGESAPAAGKIVFTSSRDGNAEVYVVDADGSGLRRLTDNPASDFFFAWSPDSSHIAFLSNRDGNQDIYVMNADGTGQTNLTKNPADNYDPAWSPAR